ncbi:ras and Rab interactor 2 isoform X6 [Erinaceus europaeus]|uniref:Ras and Rab interactor 2 isoform X6 n=1 Tax=Erinaceus europaeus TaxID=9365 RepID=A0ABM3WZH5_ERIEU|nr:ras and Rab interactor 2 isoform X6 [Erinaceus europaeus]
MEAEPGGGSGASLPKFVPGLINFLVRVSPPSGQSSQQQPSSSRSGSPARARPPGPPVAPASRTCGRRLREVRGVGSGDPTPCVCTQCLGVTGVPAGLQEVFGVRRPESRVCSRASLGEMSAWTMGTRSLDKRGSFFKLIDTIVSEIGELKQEMVQTDTSLENGLEVATEAHSMVRHKDDGYSMEKDVKSCPRDSGYDSLSNRLSILDRLLHTHPIWLQLSLSEEEAIEVLQSQPPGIFLVHKSTKMQKKVLSLRLPYEFGAPLKEFAIKESTYTFSLEGSGISFADLFRLVAFYCISRDVLPFTLKLPYAISTAKTETQLEELAQLGLNFWSSPADNKPPNPPPPHRPLSSDGVCPASRQLCLINGVHSIKTRTPSELECSQTNGALCFINPLFLKVHSQDLCGGLKRPGTRNPNANGTERPRSPPPRPPPPTINSLHTSPQLSRTAAQESMPETVNHNKHGNVALLGTKPTPIPPPRLKKQASFLEAEGNSAKTLTGGRPHPSLEPGLELELELELEPESSTAGNPGRAPPAEAPENCTRAQPASSESQPLWHGGRQRLSDMSISTSSSDSLEFDRSMPLFGYEADTNSSLEDYEGESDQETMAPPIKSKKKRNSNFVLPKLVKSQLRKMSGVFSSFMTPEKRMVRRIAELSRDKCTYFGCLVQDYVSFLQENKECHMSSTDLLQTIRQFMTQVKNYLSQSSELDPPIESLIPEDQIGRMYGADDFLPVLTYVIAQCDMLELDTEIEYMMELLDPSLLHGEGGYYLTSAYGALSLIKNFQEEQAARLLSSETRDTLRQWHKRRTTNRTIPSVDDFQNYLRVAFQEVNSGCTGKTLLVRPYITTEDVCQLCAEKFKVRDPEEYSLFLFVDETWQQLAEDTYPQKIKAELHSRPQPHIFHFVYKRIKNDPYGVVFQNGEENIPIS